MVKTSIAKLIKFENMRDLQDKINTEILDASMRDFKNMTQEFGRVSNTFVTQVVIKDNEAIVILTSEQERRTL